MKFEDWMNGVDFHPHYAASDREQGWKELAPAVKKQFPWVEYIVEIDEFRMLTFQLIKPWCEENLIGKYDVSVVSYFELEEDSVMFALRWP